MRNQRLPFIILSLTFSYMLLLGATFNGIIGIPELLPITLGLFAVLITLWGFAFLRGTWRSHQMAVIYAFFLWILVIGFSILFNLNTWRRSAEALWFVLFYMACGYVLLELFMNRIISRNLLVMAFLFAGLMVMIFAWWQVGVMIASGEGRFPQPVSLIGNVNAFGSVMGLLIPLALAWWMSIRSGWIKNIAMIYAISASVLAIMTLSRGTLLAVLAAGSTWGLLVLAEKNLLSWAALRTAYNKQGKIQQMLLWLAGASAVLVMLFAGWYLVRSLATPGRTADLRLYLWEAAWNLFTEQPVTGHGLFTFGQHLARYSSVPPDQPQSHAHNLILTIMAEMGIAGLLALGISIWLLVRNGIMNWRHAAQDRVWLAGGAAALVGFGVHHLVDTPAMMPAVALAALIVVILVIAPVESQPLANWRRITQPMGIFLLWIALLAAGFWNADLYQRYFAIMRDVDLTHPSMEELRTAAEELSGVIDADPRQPAYILQQAYLYGWAASFGDVNSAEQAISGYERYLQLEPTHAQGWANLAALYWQTGNPAQALEMIENAAALAPEWEHFRRQQEIYNGVLSDVGDMIPPEPPISRNGANWARFQYFTEIIDTEYLPQVGWGTR